MDDRKRKDQWKEKYDEENTLYIGELEGYQVTLHYLKEGPTLEDCLALYQLFCEDDIYESVYREFTQPKSE